MAECAVAEAVTVDDERPHTPPSVAVDEATQQISPKAATPEPSQGRHQLDDTAMLDAEANSEEPLAANDKCETPTIAASEQGLGIQSIADGEKEDSFVEEIKSRTPGKPMSRIEDSVEALDKLEEEIERVGVLIPEPTDVQSPTKAKKQVKSPVGAKGNKSNGSVATNQNMTAALKADIKRPTASVRSGGLRPSMQPPTAKKPNLVSGGAAKTKHDIPNKKSTPPPKAAQQPPQKAHKRVSSIHKTPFQPVKSTKPPTRATFELPGEAVSRKLKEQREQRLKREEEEKSKQPIFRARPVRRSEAPEVKLTAAVRARLSMAKGEPVIPLSTKNEAPKPRLSARPGSLAPAGANKHLSSLTVAKRSNNPPSVSVSNRTARAPSLNPSNITRSTSVFSELRPAPTAEDLAHRKGKGKEVFGRVKADLQDREKAKKEKEEAAKKARIEAAERGRAASRAWAQHQKLRKLEAEKAKNEPQAAEA